MFQTTSLVRAGAIFTMATLLGSACGIKRADLDGELSALREELRAGDQALDERIDQTAGRVGSLEAGAEQSDERFRDLERALEDLRADFDTRVTRVEGALRFDAPVHFGYDSDELRDEDRPVLQRFASVVSTHYPGATVTVEGFTDPAGDTAYNLDLGLRRANAVRSYLAETGVLQPDRIRAVSYGEAVDRQIDKGSWGERGLANRRVALVIDYAPDPGTIALKSN